MKKILLSIILALVLASCGTTMNLSGKVKKAELGMTKQELISQLGNTYKVVGAVKTAEGTMETIRFEDALYNQFYVFNFLNGELVEWFEEPPVPTPPAHNHDHR